MKTKHPILYIILVLILLIPLIFILEGLTQMALNELIPYKQKGIDINNSTIFVAIPMVSAFLLIFNYRKFIDKESFKSMGFSIKNRGFDVFFGIAVGTVLMFFGFLVLTSTGFIEITSINFNINWILSYIVLMFFVSLHEEVITRGYLLNTLMTVSNKYVALAISSIYFSLMHLMNPSFSLIAFINIMLAGLILGISYVHTKNLWFPIALHFSWNFIQGPILGFEVSGTQVNSLLSLNVSGNELITGGSFGFEGSLIATFLLIISTIALDYFFKKREKLTKKIVIGFDQNELTITEDKK